MDVRHGTLLNVYGKPVRHGGFTFMPADVALDGTMFGFDHPLAEHVGEPVPIVLRRPLLEGFDAAWVRARLPVVLGFTPDAAEIEKALIATGFAAVVGEGSVCYPFACADTYGRTSLMFSDNGPEEEVKRAIACAFWGVLLSEPDNLDDFEERVYHPGASI